MGDRSIVVVAEKAKKGAKYHLRDCRLAARIATPRRITIGRAKKDGYVACAKCSPS